MTIDECIDYIQDINRTVSWKPDEKDDEDFCNSVEEWLEEYKTMVNEDYDAFNDGYKMGRLDALDEAKKVVKKHMGMDKGYSWNNEMEIIQEELDELKAGGKDE